MRDKGQRTNDPEAIDDLIGVPAPTMMSTTSTP
jgi:hypothetical protein